MVALRLPGLDSLRQMVNSRAVVNAHDAWLEDPAAKQRRLDQQAEYVLQPAFEVLTPEERHAVEAAREADQLSGMALYAYIAEHYPEAINAHYLTTKPIKP